MFESMARQRSSCSTRIFTPITRIFAKIQMMSLNMAPYGLLMIGLFITERTDIALAVYLGIFI